MDRARSFALADGLALVAFVAVGTLNHDEDLTAARVAATAVPLLVAWFGVAFALRLYRARWPIGRLVATWALAVPLGAVGRSIVRDGPWDGQLIVFAAVALGFTALFVLAARAIVTALARAQGPGSSEPRGVSSDLTS